VKVSGLIDISNIKGKDEEKERSSISTSSAWQIEESENHLKGNHKAWEKQPL